MPEDMANAKDMGVYFKRQDYAGLLRRTAVLLIDGAVLFMAYLVLSVICLDTMADPLDAMQTTLMGVAAIVPAYLVVIKRFPGTLGYWITGVRIVDMRGCRPGFFRMIFRLLLWILGPLNVIFDLIWLTGDPNRQTLRDKLAGTYVVRKGREPDGSGRLGTTHYHIMGWNLIVQEVRRRAEAD